LLRYCSLALQIKHSLLKHMTIWPSIDLPTQLLGGITPAHFMKKFWQRQVLLVRDAIPDLTPVLTRDALFSLVALDTVESRLIWRDNERWHLRHGPQKELPQVSSGNWTVLMQGVNLHVESGHKLLERFRFIPDARLDDLMISYATDGGGVGPHIDSYDVFLIQAQGQRRWRLGFQKDQTLIEDLPVKILANFEPELEYVLNEGDILYLPPGCAHEGVAVGECMTYSVGFRQPMRGELAAELLLRLSEDCPNLLPEKAYRDKWQKPTENPGQIPQSIIDFGHEALNQILLAFHDKKRLLEYLGEIITEPKSSVWFERNESTASFRKGVKLNRKTKMLYALGKSARAQSLIFINGESFHVSGTDAKLLHYLADYRTLSAGQYRRLSESAREQLSQWLIDGWLDECS
jgi:50S ribosomal protein L16 3-hydroxylase